MFSIDNAECYLRVTSVRRKEEFLFHLIRERIQISLRLGFENEGKWLFVKDKLTTMFFPSKGPIGRVSRVRFVRSVRC